MISGHYRKWTCRMHYFMRFAIFVCSKCNFLVEVNVIEFDWPRWSNFETIDDVQFERVSTGT